MAGYFKTVQNVAGVGSVVDYWSNLADARSVAGAVVYQETAEQNWVEV